MPGECSATLMHCKYSLLTYTSAKISVASIEPLHTVIVWARVALEIHFPAEFSSNPNQIMSSPHFLQRFMQRRLVY